MKNVQRLLVACIVLVSTMLSAQTQTENYVKTTLYQTEVTEGQQDEVLENYKIESVNYFDGLGRPKQSVAVRAAGQGQRTNVLDWTQDWTVGSGSTPLFNQNGQTSENQRVFDTNPFGDQSLLWKCGNDPESNADGGWNTDYFDVDKNVTYRYTVWVKRTGSQSGRVYHGTQNVNNLDGTANGNPYFFNGYLPQLDQWYLIVGIVHPHTYTGGNSGISGVYDINGNKVRSGNDFKWRNNTTTSRFRNYLYYSTDTSTRQYFWNPVLVQLDNAGQSANQLIEESKPKDIVTHYSYDDYGRQLLEHLPYASAQTQRGNIYGNALASQQTFYNTPKYQNTTNPYSESVLENSPLNRVLEQAAPGNNFAAQADGSGHTIKMDRKTNTSSDGVVEFEVTFTNNNTEAPNLVKVGNYPVNELYITVTKDENWTPADGNNRSTHEYKDKLGRVVLKRTYASTSSATAEAHDTYYVYDDFGNLTYVIPPKVMVGDGVSTTELAELCYQYKYDNRNRLVEKKIPGKGREYIVYNKLDLPVMTQDANQRVKREWLFTKYDAFGRVVYTGLHIHPTAISRTGMQSTAYSSNYDQYETRSVTSLTVAGTTIYYSNETIPGGISEIYTVNYYDDYEIGNLVDPNPATANMTWEGMTAVTNVKGLPTLSQVRVLGTNLWITTTTYYDDKGRAWETIVKNDYLETTDWNLSRLDFVGKVEKTIAAHQKDGNMLITVDNFTYDHMGRLLTQKQQIDNQPEELIVHNVYDELGLLEYKKVGNGEQSPLQTVDYTYNVRGWLTGINDVNSLGDDLFSFKIAYDNPRRGADELYNGNISETEWKTANDNTLRWYKYSYDPLNRITKALDNSNRYSLSLVDYDKNGNITKLARRGAINATSTSFNSMDNLTYQYDYGNKLLKVNEINTKYFGFTSSYNGNSNHYAYDANGNMTIDRNKGITNIFYNHLNLPTSVQIDGKSISYIYDATGNKQKKIANTFSVGVPGNETLYAGNYIYESFGGGSEVLKFINHPEGYVEPKIDGSFSYIYQYKDHLGNIRLSYADDNKDGSISASTEIREEKNYYPFGLEHTGYNDQITGREHPYKYNGVEYNEALGLNLYEMPLRQYDPAIAKWISIDPVTHYSQSTYNAFDNNPVFWADPSGADALDQNGIVTNDSGGIFWGFTDSAQNQKSEEDNGEDCCEDGKNNGVGAWLKAKIAAVFGVFGNREDINNYEGDDQDDIIDQRSENNQVQAEFFEEAGDVYRTFHPGSMVADGFIEIDQNENYVYGSALILFGMSDFVTGGGKAKGGKTLYNFTKTAAAHMDEAGRYIPVQILDDIIKNPISILKDSQGTDAMMHYSRMLKNGKLYNVEVLYDKTKNTIMHFKYTSKAIGDLKAIAK